MAIMSASPARVNFRSPWTLPLHSFLAPLKCSEAPENLYPEYKMSALRSVAQIPPSVKYLEVVLDSNVYDVDILATYPAFTLDGSVADLGGSIVDSATVNQHLTGVDVVTFGGEGDYGIGTLFKDLGRQFLIVDAADNHLALFRQVQLVQGADTEGVGGVPPSWNCLFVKVWAAAGTNVCVVRTGPGSSA